MFFDVDNAKLARRGLTVRKWWENLAWTLFGLPNPLSSSGEPVIIPGLSRHGLGARGLQGQLPVS